METYCMPNKRPHVLIIGGGLAGLAAAVALAPRAGKITIVESRPRLGGRASSFTDPITGQLVDACQHVSMGCCTNFHHFCSTIGVCHLLEAQGRLYFMTPDRRVSRFQADPWPAPFHLGRTLLSAHYLSASEKLRVIAGLGALLLESPDADPALLPWLQRHWQTPRTIDRFWGVVLTSALNETVDRVGLKYARKVFRDGFIRHRDGFTVQVPRVPLGELYGAELNNWLRRHEVQVRLNAGVKLVDPERGVLLRNGELIQADAYMLAVPFDRVIDLIPPELASREPAFQRIPELKPSPITSVHLWFDRPVMDLPHAVLLDSLGQWVFNRENPERGEYYLQVVVSAARPLRGLGREEVQRLILEELQRLFPKIGAARLLRAKVVTEQTATFSAIPGIDRARPTQMTTVPNLYLAGDWTQTGWPATMEGAVRSGYLAAEAILSRWGKPVRLLQPDLGSTSR
jgi:squalene-associated FAD-dependent desaturase